MAIIYLLANHIQEAWRSIFNCDLLQFRSFYIVRLIHIFYLYIIDIF